MQIHMLFEWLVDPCIAFVRRNCREVVATADINLPVSLMNLFSSLLDSFKPNTAGEPPVWMTCFTYPDIQARCTPASLLRSAAVRYSAVVRC